MGLREAVLDGVLSAADAADLLPEMKQLAAARTLDELLACACRATVALTGAERAAAALLHVDELRWICDPGAAPLWLGTRVPLDRSLCAAALRDRRSLSVDDAQTDPRLRDAVDLHPSARGLYLVPFGVGVLAVCWPTPHTATARERTLTDAVVAGLPAALIQPGLRGAPDKAATLSRLQLLIDSIEDYAVFMLDERGHVATWNPGARHIKQYAAHEIIGQHFSVFYPPEDVQAGKCERELDVASQVGRFEDEGWRVRKDGSRFWANVVIGAIRNESGQLIGFSKVTRDLTERRHNEDERAARRAAAEANRAKDEFLAILGHELRNPLAPITTALQLMRLRGEKAHVRELEVMERQVGHLSRLVDDLLDVSRVTRGKVELARKPLYLADIVGRAIEMVDPLLEQRGHSLDLDVPRGDLQIHADDVRMTQVVANLLTNAAKYTPPGGAIRVTAVREHDEVVLHIADNGNGIPTELLPRIFEMFVQGRRGSDRGEGGLGLGLALVRSLVEIQGGAVSARSAGLGLGSEFTVRLPLLAAPLTLEQRRTPPAGTVKPEAPRRVLIVDDNVDAAQLLAEFLRMVGHEVALAYDGAQALATVRSYKPDIAVLDIGLPVMDGYELAAQLRVECAARVPYLVALTGYGQTHDRDRAQRAGFDEHLVKPVDTATLLRTVRAAPALA